MKFAAIDIGSNAIRLLFVNVFETKTGPVYHKDELIRVPVRLGEEAFNNGKFSDEKIDHVVKTLIAFKNLIDVHHVLAYKACATSAMRDAKNSDIILQRVKQEAGIEIEIISGDAESKFILQYPLLQSGLDPSENYLYIDVGGGSTELAFFGKGKLHSNKSFNIGTLRLLNDQVTEDEWREVVKWLHENKPVKTNIDALGVGGSINKVIKMYGKGKNFLSASSLRRVLSYIDGLSMTQRVRDLGLKPDRADVIVPALRIYINVMKWTGIDKIHVPKQGLSDGIITELYKEYKKKSSVVE
ncbi:MAG: exopolyphosphatase [Fimbriimonadaceae bacterium]|nr:exopolyphosphatase [Chitinophagales bacterium]